jgi:hypothetical protein
MSYQEIRHMTLPMVYALTEPDEPQKTTNGPKVTAAPPSEDSGILLPELYDIVKERMAREQTS